MTDLRKMSNEAINERIQLADASQKQLCAEIARSEDGDFGLGLFDVLQEMYNAGYARGAALSPARSGEPQCKCGKRVFIDIAKQVGEQWRHFDGGSVACSQEIIRSAAPQPVSGDAPEWIMKPCPKEFAAIMPSPADWLITRVDGKSRHTLYFSNEELEKLCQGYLQVIPLERLKDLRATGDAPKVVEEIARQLSHKFGFHSSRVLTYEGALEFLRPYFPPASQTPEGKSKGKLRKEIRYLKDRAEVLEAEVLVARAPAHMRAQSIAQVYANSTIDRLNHTPNGGRTGATPASTARTDGWVRVEDRLPEESRTVLVAHDWSADKSYVWVAMLLDGAWVQAHDPAKPLHTMRVTHWQPLPAPPSTQTVKEEA